MKFFGSLERKASTSVAQRASVPIGARGQPYQTQWSTQRAVRDGYERNIWVFRCVDTISTTASRLDLCLHKTADEAKEYDDPLLELLNHRPNPSETARQFKYKLSAQLLLSKAGVFVEVLRNRDGTPRELHLLPPHLTAPIPDPVSFVSGFKVQVGGSGYETLAPDDVIWVRRSHPLDPYSSSTPLEAAGLSVDMDWYARIYNRNFMANDGRPGGVLAVKGALDQAEEAELSRRFGGGPGNAGRTTVLGADDITYVDMSTSPRDAQYTQTRTITKEETLIAFGTPESVIGNASGRTFDNADAEEEVWWRITMLGHLELVAQPFDRLTRGGESDDLHLEHDVSSIQVLTRAKRQRNAESRGEVAAGLKTIDEYRAEIGASVFGDPKTETLWYPGIGAILGDPAEKNVVPSTAKVGASTLLLAQIITLNEARADYGLPPLPGGDRLLTVEEIAAITGRADTGAEGDGGPGGAQGASSGGDDSGDAGSADNAPSPLAPAPTDQPDSTPRPPVLPKPKPKPGDDTTPPEDDTKVASKVERKSDESTVDFSERWNARIDRWETAVGDVVRRFFDRQQKVVLARLNGPKARKGTRHWDPPGVKAIDPDKIVDDARWERELRDDAEPVIAKMVNEAARDAHAVLSRSAGLPRPKADDVTLEWKQLDRDEIGEIIKLRTERVTRAAGAMSQRLRDFMKQAETDSLTLPETQDKIREAYDVSDGWADSTAKTTVTSGINASAVVAASAVVGALIDAGRVDEADADRVAVKRWVTVGDDKVRDSHAEVEGEEVALGEWFSVGGNDLRYPGDFAGDDDEIMNCLPGDALVWSLSDVEAVYRRWYEGPGVRIQVAGSHDLTVTPNHPVLTTHGWTTAETVNKGDYAVRGSQREFTGPSHPNVQHMPVPIEQVFRTLHDPGSVKRVLGRDVDFHGDGRQGDVEVVLVDRQLRRPDGPTACEHGDQATFDGRLTNERALMTERLAVEFFRGGSGPSARDVRGKRDALALLDRGARHSGEHGIPSAAWLDALFKEAATYDWSRHTEEFRERLLGFPVEVSLDEIVNVEIVPLRQWVYNLQTSSGWYFGQSYTCKNCRCTLEFGVAV